MYLHVVVLRRRVYGDVSANRRRLCVHHAAAHRWMVRLAQTDQYLRLLNTISYNSYRRIIVKTGTILKKYKKIYFWYIE